LLSYLIKGADAALSGVDHVHEDWSPPPALLPFGNMGCQMKYLDRPALKDISIKVVEECVLEKGWDRWTL
jgi:hypothetical protein